MTTASAIQALRLAFFVMFLNVAEAATGIHLDPSYGGLQDTHRRAEPGVRTVHDSLGVLRRDHDRHGVLVVTHEQ